MSRLRGRSYPGDLLPQVVQARLERSGVLKLPPRVGVLDIALHQTLLPVQHNPSESANRDQGTARAERGYVLEQDRQLPRRLRDLLPHLPTLRHQACQTLHRRLPHHHRRRRSSLPLLLLPGLPDGAIVQVAQTPQQAQFLSEEQRAPGGDGALESVLRASRATAFGEGEVADPLRDGVVRREVREEAFAEGEGGGGGGWVGGGC